MALSLDADVSIIRSVTLDFKDQEDKKVIEVLIRRRTKSDPQTFMEIRVVIVGAHDAGKSTLLGYLSYGLKDNGRGRARLNLLRHRHEIESGRTSSISHEIVGYDSAGKLINFSTTNISTWEQICESSSKIVTFLDTCGHPKYLKTTIAGMTGHAPDYACLVVSANSGGLSEMTREHLAIAVMLGVPVFVVITKIDVATPEQLRLSLGSLIALLKAPGNCKVPLIVKNEDDLVVSVSHFAQRGPQIPIFLVSSVTGANMHLLERFFNLLPKPVKNYDQLLEEPVEFQIEEVYTVPGKAMRMIILKLKNALLISFTLSRCRTCCRRCSLFWKNQY
jgi:GTPase